MSYRSNISEGIAPPLLEEYLPLSEAAKRMPRGANGRKVHISTIWRWCRRGCRGVKLQYYRIGRTIMTTETALQQFFTALAKVDELTGQDGFKPPVRKRRRRPADRQESIERANQILRKAKIIV